MNRFQKVFHFLLWSNTTRRRIFIALVIFLLAFFARAHLAFTGRTEFDEPIYAKGALVYANHLKAGDLNFIIQDEYNYEHPLFNKLVYSVVLLPFNTKSPFDVPVNWSVRQIGPFYKVVAMRLASAGFGSLAVFLLALANPWAGLLLAFHTYAVKYTSVVYLESLPLFASILAIQAFSAFVQKGPGKKTIKWLVLSATALGISAASKYMYGIVGLVILLFSVFWMIRKRQPLWGYLLIWAFIALFVFWAADPVLWTHTTQRLIHSLTYSVNYSISSAAVLKKAYPFWQPIQWLMWSIPQYLPINKAFFVQPSDYWIAVDPIILLLGLIGLPAVYKRDPIYFLWLVVGMAFLLIWKTKWPQYILMVLPPLCISAAWGLHTILTAAKEKVSTGVD
jgi:hypothetical protein